MCYCKCVNLYKQTFTIFSDRPASIPVHVKHMADTSNFDDFEELEHRKGSVFKRNVWLL